MKRRSFLAMVAALPIVAARPASASISAPYVGQPYLSVVMSQRMLNEVCGKLPSMKSRIVQRRSTPTTRPHETDMVEIVIHKPEHNHPRPVGLPMKMGYGAHSIIDLETETVLKSRDGVNRVV